jgi:hypothetical protein
MPYLEGSIKDALENSVISMSHPGHLNYLITQLCQEYQELNGLSYQTINDIVGALTCAKEEYYRRVAVPYENQKIKSNGDVYL